MSKPKKRFKLPWLTLAAVLVPLVFVAAVIFVSQDSRSSLPKFYEKVALPSSFHLEKKQNMKPGKPDGYPSPVAWRYTYTTSESPEQAKHSLTDLFTRAGYVREEVPGDNIILGYDKNIPDLKDVGNVELSVAARKDNDRTLVTVDISGMVMK